MMLNIQLAITGINYILKYIQLESSSFKRHVMQFSVADPFGNHSNMLIYCSRDISYY